MSVSTHRSHRRTSIPAPRHTHQPRHTSPPPPRVSSRGWPRHHPLNESSTNSGNYTLAWQPDREEEYIALYGHRESRRPRARTIAASTELDARAARTRPRSAPLSSSALDLWQPCSASRAWLASGSRKDRRKVQRRPAGVVRRDSGYESDDADDDANNEEPVHYSHSGRRGSTGRMSVPHAQSHQPFPPSGWPGSSHTSLLRPDSPSNESSASTDDDYYNGNPASTNPFALEYYLGNDDTWRDAEICSQSSDESGSSDEEWTIARRLNEFATGSSRLLSDMGDHPYIHTTRRHRRPRMPKRIPLVPTCSGTRKRSSMRAAWKMRFGRLFESDSEAATEVEDELDWEGYESADARRIVALRIHKAGGGDGRKVMEGRAQLTELLVKKPADPRRLARRVPRRRARGDTAATVRPRLQSEPEPAPEVDACPTCAVSVSAETTPTSSEPLTLPTPTSTPPTSVPSTPCPSCAQLSPRGDAAGLPSPLGRRKTLSPGSPPCKTMPLHAGTDPLTVFALTVEQERQRDFSGLLKRSGVSSPASPSVFSGLVQGVKSWIGRINHLVDMAASTPLTTAAVGGTCPLSPVMVGAVARGDIGTTRRRAASAPPTPEAAVASPRLPRRRRSLVRALPGAPTSPYGYRVRPQEVSAAFPTRVDEHVEEEDVKVAATAIPSAAVELQDVLTRPAEEASPAPAFVAPAIEVKAPPEGKRRRASRSRSPSRRKERKETVVRAAAEREEVTHSRAVADSKYWRVLAGEMEQRRRGGVEVAFMVRLAVEEGRNLPIFTSEEQQAVTGEIVVGGVWKASLVRWRMGGVGKGSTRIRSGLINEVVQGGDGSDVVSDSSSSLM